MQRCILPSSAETSVVVGVQVWSRIEVSTRVGCPRGGQASSGGTQYDIVGRVGSIELSFINFTHSHNLRSAVSGLAGSRRPHPPPRGPPAAAPRRIAHQSAQPARIESCRCDHMRSYIHSTSDRLGRCQIRWPPLMFLVPQSTADSAFSL
jgi:hypothetical protein